MLLRVLLTLFSPENSKIRMDNLVNRIDKTTAEIYLYGIIGAYLDIDTNKLTAEIETRRKEGINKYIFYVNSDGGEVVQGSSLFNYLDRTDIDVTFVIDGVAASMMAMLITNPKHKVVAAKHAKFMYHRVQGYVYGNSAEVRAHADMIDTFEGSLIEMMAARMKVDKEAVKAEFFTDGTDHWLSAEQAKERGLVDSIIVNGKKMKEPDLLTNTRDVFNFYNNQIINIKKQQNMAGEKNLYALALGLPTDEDDSKVLNQIQSLVNEKNTLTASLQAKDTEITALKAKLQTFETAKVTTLINQAIADKKFGEDERENYTALAEKDYDSVEKIINKLPGVKSITAQLGNETTGGDAWAKRQEEIEKGGSQ
jgi:ATP-dependent Clp endopeptidase proteolytic subunit ClpP